MSFGIPITNPVAMLTGIEVGFSPYEDRELGFLHVDVTCEICDDPTTVRVTANYGLRDWSNTFDDYYEGKVFFVVFAESGRLGNNQLADMADATIKGRGTGTGPPQDLTATEATAILDAFAGDSGTGGTKGLVPAPAAGDAAAHKLLAASGSWVAPVPVTPERTLFVAQSWPSSADPTIFFIKIKDALAQAATMAPAPSKLNPVAISISPGTYAEDIVLKSWVFLSSASTDQNAVTIIGKVAWTPTDVGFEVVQLYFVNIAGPTIVTTAGKGMIVGQNNQTSLILHGCFVDGLEVKGRSSSGDNRDFVFAATCAPGRINAFTLTSCLFEWVAGRLNGMTFDGDCLFRIIGSTQVPYNDPTDIKDWFVQGTSTGICTGDNFTNDPNNPIPPKDPVWRLMPGTKVMFRGCTLAELRVAAGATADIRTSECPKLNGPGAVSRRSLRMPAGPTTTSGLMKLRFGTASASPCRSRMMPTMYRCSLRKQAPGAPVILPCPRSIRNLRASRSPTRLTATNTMSP